MAVSQNGYSIILSESGTRLWKLGNRRLIRMRPGNTGWLLQHFADWFDAHVENIEGGQFDDWGWAVRRIAGYYTLSNHGSATAMDINALRHPMGVRGTFSSAQSSRIRTELRRYEGCIRWGGDYYGRKDEMHFEINKGPETCARVAKKLGEGIMTDEPTGLAADTDDDPDDDKITDEEWADGYHMDEVGDSDRGLPYPE